MMGAGGGGKKGGGFFFLDWCERGGGGLVDRIGGDFFCLGFFLVFPIFVGRAEFWAGFFFCFLLGGGGGDFF